MPQSQGILKTLYLGSPVYSMTKINQNPKEAEPMPVLLTSCRLIRASPKLSQSVKDGMRITTDT